MKWITRLYIIFLGIIFTVTTGFGVAAFYPEPTRPSYPISRVAPAAPQSCYATPASQNSKECQTILLQQQEDQQKQSEIQQKYDKEIKVYEQKSAGYTRTAIFFGIAIGALYAIFGIGLIKKNKLVSAGLLLAGLLTAVFTRLLIGLASLGSSVAGTAAPDNLAYIEFGILLILSIAVVVVGLLNLKDEEHLGK